MNLIRQIRKPVQWIAIVVFFLLVSQFNLSDVAIAQSSGSQCPGWSEGGCDEVWPIDPDHYPTEGACIIINGGEECCNANVMGDYCSFLVF